MASLSLTTIGFFMIQLSNALVQNLAPAFMQVSHFYFDILIERTASCIQISKMF